MSKVYPDKFSEIQTEELIQKVENITKEIKILQIQMNPILAKLEKKLAEVIELKEVILNRKDEKE
jgi:hypothetical protein